MGPFQPEAGAQRTTPSTASPLEKWLEGRKAGYISELGRSYPGSHVQVSFVGHHSTGEQDFILLLKDSLEIITHVPEALVLHARIAFVPTLLENVQTAHTVFLPLSHPEVWTNWAEEAIAQAQTAGRIDELQFLVTANLETNIQTYSSVAKRCLTAYREEVAAYLEKRKELGVQVPTQPRRPPPPIMTIAQRVLHLKLDQCSLLPEQLNLLVATYAA